MHFPVRTTRVGSSAVSAALRAVRLLLFALLGVILLIAGCGAPAPPPPPPGPTAAPPALPAHCTRTVTKAQDVAAVLDAAAAGDTLCFTGGDLTGADLTMRRSGTAAAPIVLTGGGTTVHDIHIAADYVIVQGFTLAGGDGLLLEGGWLTARQNTVRDTLQGGIACLPCADATIEGNTVNHTASTGLDIAGERILVKGNTVIGTVARNGGDADGIRFAGDGQRIIGNTIRDISANGYANPPHPDCFQTFDGDAPTFDVVISGNTCTNVDAQCLIATGDRDANAGAPAGVASIVFAGNTCATNGSQAVNLRRWPRVELRQNRFSGPTLIRAILIADGSTGATVVGNNTAGHVPTVEIDSSSRPGSHVADNIPA